MGDALRALRVGRQVIDGYALRFVFEPTLIVERHGARVETPAVIEEVARSSRPSATIWLSAMVTPEAMERGIDSEVRALCIDIAESADFKRAMEGIGLAFRRWAEERS